MKPAVKKVLFVHMLHSIVEFDQLKNNLYRMNPSDPSSHITIKGYETKNIQMLNVVEDNLQYMSERQQSIAGAACKTYQAIGTPTTKYFKAMVRMILIRNSEITIEDINFAEMAFGPDVGAIKGKLQDLSQTQHSMASLRSHRHF